MITFAQMLDIGLDRMINLAQKDHLRPASIWTAVRGGFKYVSALASGDRAPQQITADRLAICRSCQALDQIDTSKPKVRAAYCGTGEEINGKPTCGCLVSVTVNGRSYAAGKILVASESCPWGLWGKVDPDRE